VDNAVITLPVTAAADSHVGLVRKVNEDSYGYYIDPRRNYAVFAVADGIGGHGNGDVASAICIRMILEKWRNFDLNGTFDAQRGIEFFRLALDAANQKIFEINNRFSFRYPMGTTVVAALLTEHEVVAAHVGDSRLYRLAAGGLRRVTEDHSFVAEMVRNNIITAEEAKNHPFSHIISRSIGPNEKADPEFSTFERCHGDRLLLCSDGLNIYASDVEIQDFMAKASAPQEAVGNLLKLSLRRGGEDNVTMLNVFL